MKILFSIAVAALAAAPAFAGDQPVVIYFGKPTEYTGPVPVYETQITSGPVRFQFDTGLTGGPATASSVATASGTAVGQVGLSQGDTDALYARVLKEARARQLR